MKKLMIAAAIVCAAAMSQAAAVDWCYYDNSEMGDQIGYTVYCIAGAMQTEWESVDAVKAAAAKLTDSVGVIEEAGRFVSTPDMTSYGSGLTSSSGYYFVIVNDTEDKYGVTAGDNDYVYDPEAQETSPGTLNIEDVATTSSFGAVPEPTSGLLLLLGVAGLALRRRRA